MEEPSNPEEKSFISSTSDLSAPEIERYSRQLLLPSFGPSSQQALKSSSIVIIGAGGLGCPALLYLSGAGVGTLGIVDRPEETVEVSNLHRQTAHSTPKAGMLKIHSAKIAGEALNPMIDIKVHEEGFNEGNAEDILEEYDVALDCTDNVASRYLINDACISTKTPLVSGSAIGLEGQLTVYGLNKDTPCYRCLFPKAPPVTCVGSCDTGGVLGPIPGTIGTMQALEALKIVGKIKGARPLAGRMLIFDGGESIFRTVKLRKPNPDCVCCGRNRKVVVKKMNYKKFAAGRLGTTEEMNDGTMNGHTKEYNKHVNARRITAKHLAQHRQKYLLIDVRPTQQYNMCALPDSISVPISELNSDVVQYWEQQARERDTDIALICRRGNQSQKAVREFRNAGVENARDVIGGLAAWSKDIDRRFPLY